MLSLCNTLVDKFTLVNTMAPRCLYQLFAIKIDLISSRYKCEICRLSVKKVKAEVEPEHQCKRGGREDHHTCRTG